MRVFLTGVNGYLGRVLAEHFAREPAIAAVTGIDVHAPPSLPAKTTFVRLDVRSPQLAAAVAGHDVVVHTAFVVAWPHRMPAAERDDVNLHGTVNVARAAVAGQVRRFVYSSSDAAYDQHLLKGRSGVTEDFPLGRGDASSYYCNAKAALERTLTDLVPPAGIALTMFRPGYIMGPRNTTTIASLRSTAVKLIGHDPRSQHVHEYDVATAFTQAVLTDLPGAYNLVPDDSVRLSEVQRILGIRHHLPVPVWLARRIMYASWRWFGSTTHASWLDVMLADFTLSNAKLRATGWAPRYGSVESLRSALGA